MDRDSVLKIKAQCFDEIKPYLNKLKITKGSASCLSPFRDDKNPGSFHIFLDKEFRFYDFATGENGDVIDIYCHIKDIPLNEFLRERLPNNGKMVEVNHGREKILKSTIPSKALIALNNKAQIPKLIPAPISTPVNDDFIHPTLGMPHYTNLYEYIDINGKSIGFSVRFELGEGKKVCLPFTYDWELKKWGYTAHGFYGQKPIYNECFLKFKKLNFLIVEGEKTAFYARLLIANSLLPVAKNTEVLSWFGGSQCVDLVNWDLVKKACPSTIYLSPDMDTPGSKASLYLKNIFSNAVIVKPINYHKGFDIADYYNNLRG